MEEFLTVARVVKTQGRRGEVAADILTDFPERFATRTRLYAVPRSGERRELQVEEHWFHKGRVVFKFAGVDDMNAAEALIGCEVQIAGAERAEPEAGAVFVAELLGATVLDGGTEVGEIEDVRFGYGEAPMLVVRRGNKEWMIPFVEGFIEKMDLAGKRLAMKLPEGLLDVDAPVAGSGKAARQRDGGDAV